MRRLITVVVLVALLIVAAALATPARSQPPQGGQLRGYIDRNNNVVCYQVDGPITNHNISCVFIPRDGVQVNLPKGPVEGRT